MAKISDSENSIELDFDPQDLTSKIHQNLSVLQALSVAQANSKSHVTFQAALQQRFPKEVLNVIAQSQLNPTAFRSSTFESLGEYSDNMSEQEHLEVDLAPQALPLPACVHCGSAEDECLCEPSHGATIPQQQAQVSPPDNPIREEGLDSDTEEPRLEASSQSKGQSSSDVTPTKFIEEPEIAEPSSFVKAMGNRASAALEKMAGMVPNLRSTGAPNFPAFSRKSDKIIPPKIFKAPSFPISDVLQAPTQKSTTLETLGPQDSPSSPVPPQLNPDAPSFHREATDAEIEQDFNKMVDEQEDEGRYNEWVDRKIQWGQVTVDAKNSKDIIVQELCSNAYNLECIIDEAAGLARTAEAYLQPQDIDDTATSRGQGIYHQLARLNLTMATVVDNQNAMFMDLMHIRNRVDERLKSIEATIQSKFDQVMKAIQNIPHQAPKQAPTGHQGSTAGKLSGAPPQLKPALKKGKHPVDPPQPASDFCPQGRKVTNPMEKRSRTLPARKLTEKQWEYVKRCQKDGFSLDEINAQVELDSRQSKTTEASSSGLSRTRSPSPTSSGPLEEPKIPTLVKSSLAKVDPVTKKQCGKTKSGELLRDLDHVIRRFELRDKNPMFKLLTTIRNTHRLKIDPTTNLRDYNPEDLFQYTKSLRDFIARGGELEPLGSQN